jgi:hypothetical protein
MTLRDAIQVLFLEKSRAIPSSWSRSPWLAVSVWPSYETEARLNMVESLVPTPTILRPSQMLLTDSGLVNSEIQIPRNRYLVAKVVDQIGVGAPYLRPGPQTLMQRIKHLVKQPIKQAKKAVSWALDKLD